MYSQRKTIIIIAVVLVLIISLGFIATRTSLFKNLSLSNLSKSAGGGGISSDILYLTSPVFSFTGQIENISGNTITLSQTATLRTNQAIAAPMTPDQSDSQPITKKLTYKVTVDKNTSINRPDLTLPPIDPAKPASQAVQPILTINDLKKGETVTALSNNDLRTLAGNSFTAASLQLAPKQTTLSGTIAALSGNSLTVKSYLLPSSDPTQATSQDYQITITDQTEIVENDLSADPLKPGQSRKASLSSLKKDQSVTVKTKEDINTQTRLTALKIEVMAMTAAPVLNPPSATSPAMTSPVPVKL